MNRKILSALTVLSVSAAIGGTFAAPSYAASEVTAVAFQGALGTLWNWSGVPGENGNLLAEPAFLPLSSGGMAFGTSPSEAVLANGETVVAFQGRDGDLWTWEGDPVNTGLGHGASTGLGMARGTSPSLTVGPSGLATVAFQANTGTLWTWEGTPGTVGFGAVTGVEMAAGTSPSVGTLTGEGQETAVAFQGNDGLLGTWEGFTGNGVVGRPNGTAVGTGLGMARGTSPSIVIFDGSIAVVAFQANNGILWTWEGDPATVGFGASTGVGMASGTSPSVTNGVNGGAAAIAFQANNGVMSTWIGNTGGAGGAHVLQTGLGMASGTSPSITALASGEAAVAFQANNGALWTWIGNAGTVGFGASTTCGPAGDTCPDGGLGMASGTSPSIGADIAPHGFSLTAKGNVLAQLRKPRTLVLLVYLTPKPPAQRHTPPSLKLLGRVALGQHPAGLSQITWGLRVHGHRLAAGHYLAELEALIDGDLTTGGPTVNFDVGQRGKLTIVTQSCPARASADATAATVC